MTFHDSDISVPFDKCLVLHNEILHKIQKVQRWELLIKVLYMPIHKNCAQITTRIIKSVAT
jgi:hypothetical protein